MKNLVVFTGAGISAESGLKTFRDSDGLWEQYNVMEVATPEAWKSNPRLVLQFYNERRKQVIESEPNEAHWALAALDEHFNTTIITQNIDNLHERAGSKKVLHLHGEITKSQSSQDAELVYDIVGWELNIGKQCELGSQLRPHVVWFGESVPNMEKSYEITAKSDIFMIIGTSLNVHPAAGIIHFTNEKCKKYLVDPNDINISDVINLTFIKEKASIGVPMLAKEMIENFA